MRQIRVGGTVGEDQALFSGGEGRRIATMTAWISSAYSSAIGGSTIGLPPKIHGPTGSYSISIGSFAMSLRTWEAKQYYYGAIGHQLLLVRIGQKK